MVIWGIHSMYPSLQKNSWYTYRGIRCNIHIGKTPKSLEWVCYCPTCHPNIRMAVGHYIIEITIVYTIKNVCGRSSIISFLVFNNMCYLRNHMLNGVTSFSLMRTTQGHSRKEQNREGHALRMLLLSPYRNNNMVTNIISFSLSRIDQWNSTKEYKCEGHGLHIFSLSPHHIHLHFVMLTWALERAIISTLQSNYHMVNVIPFCQKDTCCMSMLCVFYSYWCTLYTTRLIRSLWYCPTSRLINTHTYTHTHTHTHTYPH